MIVTPGVSLATFKLFIYVAGFGPGAPPIDGESIDANHQNWIDGISYASDIMTDGDLACFKDIKITKYFDKSSPILSYYAALKNLIGTVTIDFCEDTPGAECFLRIELKGVLVTSISSVAKTTGDEVKPLEEVSFAFRDSILWSYTIFRPDGSTSGTVDERLFNPVRCDGPIFP
jgi:type VI secretion system Hcp family effector